MADDNALKFRVDVENVPQAKTLLDQLAESLGKVSKSAKDLVGDAQKVGQGFSAMQESFSQGNAIQGFAGAMQALSGAFSAATNPIGLATEALSSFYLETKRLSTEAVGLFRSLQQLQAVSGESARNVQVIGHAFELAGVPAETLNMAMFRLGNEIERGGKTLQRFGVSVTDEFGQMKTEGKILLDVRDALSEIGDASTRNAVLLQMFGRAGRSLAPIMAKSREEFAHFLAMSEEAASASKSFMDQTAAFVTVQAEANHEWEKLNIEIAKAIALPVETWLVGWIGQWVSGLNSILVSMEKIYHSPVFKVLSGLAAPISGVAGMAAMGSTGEGYKDDVVGDAEATLAATSKALEKSGGKGILNTVLGQEKAKEMEQVLKDDRDLSERRLRAQEQFEMVRSKMETGSDQQALEFKRKANAQIIAMEEKLYQDLMEIEKRKGTSGTVAPAVEEKLRKERDTKVQAAEAENQKIGLQSQQAAMTEMKKYMDAEIKMQSQVSGEYLAQLKDRAKQELAILQESGESREQIARRAASQETDVAEAAGKEKISVIDSEIKKWQEYKKANEGIFAAEFEANQKLNELSVKRVAAERERNDQIFNARKTLIDKLRQLAEQEASAAEGLESKAIARMQKRGQRSGSMTDVLSEIDRMRAEAQSTLSAYGAGGVNFDKLKDARSVAPGFGKLGDSGASGGLSTLQAMQQAQLSGITPNVGPGGSTLPSLTGMVTSANIKKTLSDEIANGAQEGAARGAAAVLDAFSAAFGKVGKFASDAAGGGGGNSGGGTQGGEVGGVSSWRKSWNPTGADEPAISDLTVEIARQLGKEAKRY